METIKAIAGLKPGDDFVTPVASVDGRFYAQADNTLVSAMPYPWPQIQVTFLSIRVRYKSQTIVVTAVDPANGSIDGNPPQYHGEAEATDVGSVRMNPESAIDLGVALIGNARGSVSQEVFAEKLAAAGLAVK